MPMGIMGVGAAFMQAACAKAKKTVDGIKLTYSVADPSIDQLSCIGEITVISIKDGEKVAQTYNDLTDTTVAIQADANTEIIIAGGVTKIRLSAVYGSYMPNSHAVSIDTMSAPSLIELNVGGNVSISTIDVSKNTSLQKLNVFMLGLTALDLSANTALTSLDCNSCAGITSLNLSANTALTSLNCGTSGITSLDLSDNTALTNLDCNNCAGITSLDLSANTALTSLNCVNSGITSLDLSANTALTSLSCSDCAGLKEIRYPATNDDVSTAIAGAITDATAADGTVYTNSAADYYSTIADAATAKGWTIEQL